jgi:magnesium chelatase family protein
LDRIDILIEMPRVEYEKLTDTRVGERSADVRTRVRAARERQSGTLCRYVARDLQR